MSRRTKLRNPKSVGVVPTKRTSPKKTVVRTSNTKVIQLSEKVVEDDISSSDEEGSISESESTIDSEDIKENSYCSIPVGEHCPMCGKVESSMKYTKHNTDEERRLAILESNKRWNERNKDDYKEKRRIYMRIYRVRKNIEQGLVPKVKKTEAERKIAQRESTKRWLAKKQSCA